MRGREVIVLEKNRAIGEETSARNSEVIHAGIYYPTGSLKARLCVEGRQRLYAYCAEKGIPHRRCGKLIVAVHEAQRPKLDALAANRARERRRRPRAGSTRARSRRSSRPCAASRRSGRRRPGSSTATR